MHSDMLLLLLSLSSSLLLCIVCYAIHASNLDISAVDDDTLAPFVAHDPGDFLGAVLADESADEVQSAVDTRQHARRGQHAQASEAEVGALDDAFAAGVADLEANGALASSARAAPAVGTLFDGAGRCRPALGHAALLTVLLLGQQVRVFVLVLAEVEAQVIDDVAGVHDVRAVGHVALGGVAADDFELGHIVRVRSGGEAGQDARLAQEERAGADAHEGALAGWVLLLLLGEGFDEGKWLGLGLDDFLRLAADDDEDIDLVQARHGVFVAEVGFDGGALGAGDVLVVAGEDGAEGFGLWVGKRVVRWVCLGCDGSQVPPYLDPSCRAGPS
jgi:hypothetical protein